jgi:dihydroneopterin aldolase
MTDWIHLEQIRFPCKIGTSWAEHQREQPLEASIHFGLDLSSAAAEDLSRTIDYAQVLTQVETIARHGGWRLLETLGTVLTRWFLLEPGAGEARGAATRVRVLLKKPEACAGRAIPAVEMERTRSENKIKHINLGMGAEQLIVGETEWVTVSRIDLQPQRHWSPPKGALVLQLPGAAQRTAGTVPKPQRVEAELNSGTDAISWLVMHGPAVNQAAS